MPDEILLVVNEKPHIVQAREDTPLLYVLRNELGLTSPHVRGELHGSSIVGRVILLAKKYNKERGMTLTISEKGWVVIPAELRRKYQLTPGSEVIIVDYGGVLSIVPATKNPVQQGRGMLTGVPSLANDLRKEHAKERAQGSSKTK